MDDQPLEPLDIDDGSAGERGLAGLDGIVDRQGFELAAVIWMVSTVAFVGVQVYTALDLLEGAGGTFDTWSKIAALGQTGGPIVALSCLAGIALATLAGTRAARFAVFLAGATGAWVVVAGLFDVAATLHRSEETLGFGFSQPNRAVGVIGGLALAGLGLVVSMLAWRVYYRDASRVSPPQQTLR